MGFFYFSANPFIYTVKFDPVRRILVGLIPWKKSEQAGVSVERPAPGRSDVREIPWQASAIDMVDRQNAGWLFDNSAFIILYA